MVWASVVTKIPWPTVIEAAARLLEKGMDIFNKPKPAAPAAGNAGEAFDAMWNRVAALEDYEKGQAELIKKITERQDGLVSALTLLDLRAKHCLMLSAIGLLFSIVAILIAVFR